MITSILGLYSQLLWRYYDKWKKDRIDKGFRNWEEDQEMRKDLGYEEYNFKRIPKRKIKCNAARKKHGY